MICAYSYSAFWRIWQPALLSSTELLVKSSLRVCSRGGPGHVFRHHFGGPPPQARQGPTEPVPLRSQLLHLLPLLALLLFTYMSFKPSEPVSYTTQICLLCKGMGKEQSCQGSSNSSQDR